MKWQRRMSRAAAVAAGAFGIAAAAAAETVKVDFEDGKNPFTTGAVSDEFAFGGARSLYVGPGVNAALDIPEALRGKTVKVSMMVLDRGVWAEAGIENGPRWGVSAGGGDGEAVGVGIHHRHFLNSKTHYSLNSKNARFGSPTTMTSIRDRGAAGPEPGKPAEKPVWVKWTFFVTPEGIVRVQRDAKPAIQPHGMTHHAESMGGPATQVFITGGQGPLAGVYVDDIEIAAAEEAPAP